MKNWTIGKRIAFGFTILLALFAGLAGSSWYQTVRLSESLTQITTDSLPGVRLTGDLVRETLLYRVISLRHVISTDAAEMVALNAAADQQLGKIMTVLDAYKNTVFTDEEKQIS